MMSIVSRSVVITVLKLMAFLLMKNIWKKYTFIITRNITLTD